MKWYPKFLQWIVLPLSEKLLGTPYNSIINEWKQLEKLDAQSIRTLQENKLKKLLVYAVTNVTGYRLLPIYATLKDFPIATKAMYRKDEDMWISTLFKKKSLIVEKSSGSSGVQGKVFMSRSESIRALAHQTYLWTWAGYAPGERILQLGITPNRKGIKWLKDRFFRTVYRPAFNLSEKIILDDFSKISIFPKKSFFFGGYASGIFEYARVSQKNEIKSVCFDAVISWGDKMFDNYRKIIEFQFNTKVYDTYGCTEGLMIAGQCHFGKYHILSPHIYLELLDENGNEVKEGEIGHVVVTRLDAFAMPLIRYRLGDLAIKESENVKCECGKPFPILRRIVGRETDLVRTPSGKNLIVHFFTGIMEHRTEIIQFRIVQEQADHFVLEYIPESDVLRLEDTLLGIHAEMEQKAGEKLNIFFKKVTQILPTPSGKPQIISSSLKGFKQYP